MSETVRAVRIIEYVGDREWVEATVAKSIHGTLVCCTAINGRPERAISAMTIVPPPGSSFVPAAIDGDRMVIHNKASAGICADCTVPE